jgi:glucose-6-phosphate isomerase
MDLMQWPEPRSFDVDLQTGLMTGTDSRYQKFLRDLDGLYADSAAFEALSAARGDEVVYEVTDHRPNSNPGDLITGVTRMSPGKVGTEFFMTRGHIHAAIDRPELYFGLKGVGVMVMESPTGDTRVVEIGQEDFVMLFCYPADSGQDYAIIEQSNGMKLRIVDDGAGSWRSVPNPDYKPRTQQDVEALLARGVLAAEGVSR